MMLTLLIPLIQPLFSINVTLSEKYHQTSIVHLKQSKSIIELPNAIDAFLIAHQNNSFCHLRQRSVSTKTQQFTLIQDQDFKDFEFENDTPLNFRQFIGMVHIRDGMIAITSDSQIYMLKFNYNQIHKTNDFKSYGNGKEFASLVWKADLQRVLLSEQSKTEIPQIVFAEQANLALILFSDTAQAISVTQLESNLKTVDVHGINNWISRKERGLSKEIEGLVLTVVGQDGLDIYQIEGYDLKFLKNLVFTDLDITSGQMHLKDFAIIKKKEGEYNLYLLDENRGILIVKLLHSKNVIQVELIMDDISPQAGGIALDTINGNNVFAVYKQLHRYYIVEYYIDVNTKTHYILNDFKTYQTIIDVDATDEFAILQGLNQFIFIFANTYKEMVYHTEPIILQHIGLRDFQFFKISSQKDKLESIQGEFIYDDFFFGITANSAFLTKFSVKPPSIICYSDNSSLLLTQQHYNLIYNESEILNGKLNINEVFQSNKSITVELVKTYLFEEQMIVIEVFAAIIGILVLMTFSMLCYWWHNFRKEQQELEEQIKQYRVNAHNQSNNKLQIDSSMDKKEL